MNLLRILHVITDLNVGGAETMLYRLLTSSAPGDVHEVVSLTDLGPIAERIQRLGVRTQALGMRRLPTPAALQRLFRLVRDVRPDVVQTWMYHADLLGGLAARAAGAGRIVWGVHASSLDVTKAHRTTHWTVAICAMLSRWVPDRIVCVSRMSRDLHVAAGYSPEKFIVIPNGFDLAEYKPDAASRRDVRREFGVDDDCVVIGVVARVHPQKDHLNFIRAAGLLSRSRPNVKFLICGEGATASNEGLVRAIASEAPLDRFLLLGPRADTPRVMNGLDIGTLSSSWGEAFPLVIGEAMACGVPCVVTDVGDCAYLVGTTGRVVPPRNAEALAQAWDECVQMGPAGRRRAGLAARRRIEANFSLSRIAEEYAAAHRGTDPGPAEPAPVRSLV